MRIPKLSPGTTLLIGGLLALSGLDQRLLAANAGGLGVKLATHQSDGHTDGIDKGAGDPSTID